jgi:hypothetical protein
VDLVVVSREAIPAAFLVAQQAVHGRGTFPAQGQGPGSLSADRAFWVCSATCSSHSGESRSTSKSSPNSGQ